MEINKISTSPNFQAKLIIGDSKIQKFVKASFISKSRETFDTLDKFSEIYPDTVASVWIKNDGNKNYLVIKNGINGASEKKVLRDIDTVMPENNSIFIDLVKKALKKKSFWLENK